jgi:hypothetical protein
MEDASVSACSTGDVTQDHLDRSEASAHPPVMTIIRRSCLYAVVTIMVLVGLDAAPNAARAAPPTKRPSALCVTVTARMPKSAHLGDTVQVSWGMENCGTKGEYFVFAHWLTGPCGTKEGSRERMGLPPGMGFISGQSFRAPCDGRYRLVVKALLHHRLLDRKVRHMTVSG